MAQSIFIKKAFGHLSKIHLSPLWSKGETGKNREKKSDQPFLPCLPDEEAKNIVTSSVPLQARREVSKQNPQGLLQIIASEPLCLGIADPLFMQRQILLPGPEPLHRLLSLDWSALFMKQDSIRGIHPIAEVFRESMLLRILMDVGNHIPELPVCGDRNVSKRVIVDFCAPCRRRISEVDGSQHLAQAEYDLECDQ